VLRVARDGDRAVGVGAQDHGALGVEGGHGALGRVTVGVVGAAGDDGQAGTEAGQKRWVLVGGAVVGDLEDVDAGQGGGCGQEALLGRGFEIAEEQEGQPSGADEKSDAGVVGAVVGKRAGTDGWPEYLPVQGTEVAMLARGGADDRDLGRCRLTADVGGLLGRLVQGGGLDRSDSATTQDAGEAVHMVGVEVAEDQQGDGGHAEGAQAAVGQGRLGAGVDDDGGARPSGGQHEGIALADVTGHQAPARWWPAGDGSWQRGGAEHGQEEQHGGGRAQPGVAGEAAAEEDGGRGEGGEEQRAGPAPGPVDRRAGQRGSTAGDGGDPSGRPTGQPREGFGERHRDRRRGQRGEAEHRGEGDREFGEEVARDRHQADVGGEHRDDRCADRLGGSRGRQEFGQAGWDPAALEGGAPARGEGEKRTGGQDGQQESIRAGEPRVVEEQQKYGRCQGREQGAAASGADGEQRDQAAGGGAQHARVGAADDDEPEGEQAA
jgi:hypothetical protein